MVVEGEVLRLWEGDESSFEGYISIAIIIFRTALVCLLEASDLLVSLDGLVLVLVSVLGL